MSVRRRTADRRTRLVILVLTLVAATVLLAGCGEGDHLPAGVTSADIASSGSALDGILGTDPGPSNANVLGDDSALGDDPVLADYSGTDDIDSVDDGSDMWANAESELSEDQGSLGMTSLDAPLDDPIPAGYGYGGYGNGCCDSGYGSMLGTGNLYNAYGYGGSALSTPAMIGGAADGGMLDGGLLDDPTFDDLGGSITDPGIGDLSAAGALDMGAPVDMSGGFDIGGFDAAPVDLGGMSGGFAPAPMDIGGPVDIGGPAGIGAGVPDIGSVDVGSAPVDVSGGVGGFDIGGMDAGIGF